MITAFSREWRLPLLGVLLIVSYLVPIKQGSAAETGQQIFQSNCAVCHTVGGGRLVGPDLAGVHDQRSQGWLQKFIKSSQSMVKGGDADAIAVFKEYNNIVMPDIAIPDGQIKAVLEYIKSASAGSSAKASSGDSAQQAATPASEEDIAFGGELFQGKKRFDNKGPTCISCHDVKNDAVIGGGILATELTRVFTKMGGGAVRAILGTAPFPVMNAAYKDKALTDKEITALIAFLQDADNNFAYENPRDYGMGLLVSGVIGAFILFGFYSLLWLRRRKESVNQKIYDRQVKSE